MNLWNYAKSLVGIRASHQIARPSIVDIQKQFIGELRTALRAKWDVAQDHTGNLNHWKLSDFLDPHAAASLQVRQKLRSRSRYETMENNCYLKGMLLMMARDFVGSGPRLQITDSRLSRDQKQRIERQYRMRARKIKMRRKLWEMRVAKMVNGEGFMFAFNNRRLRLPTTLDWKVVECDQVSHFLIDVYRDNEIDGLRYDKSGEPTEYHLLDNHPGSAHINIGSTGAAGRWIPERFVIHWFRRDRPWLRGIPETVQALPLCAILRRYTLAVLESAEFAANVSGVLESDGPAASTYWTNLENLDAATGGDIFPVERGLFVTTPWGYKLHQFDAKQPMQTYDMFVNAIVREIGASIQIPFNRAASSSKDSNMASAIYDEWDYKGAVKEERLSCEEEVLDKDYGLWWFEAMRVPDYLEDIMSPSASIGSTFPSMLYEPPEHTWRWDQIGIEHQDPEKVANAKKILQQEGFLTDRDIQERDYNRDYEDWQEEITEQDQFRQTLKSVGTNPNMRPQPEPAGANNA